MSCAFSKTKTQSWVAGSHEDRNEKEKEGIEQKDGENEIQKKFSTPTRIELTHAMRTS